MVGFPRNSMLLDEIIGVQGTREALRVRWSWRDSEAWHKALWSSRPTLCTATQHLSSTTSISMTTRKHSSGSAHLIVCFRQVLILHPFLDWLHGEERFIHITADHADATRQWHPWHAPEIQWLCNCWLL